LLKNGYNIGQKNEWTMKIAKNMPQQENNYDCGVFTILYAKFLNENKSEHFTQMDIPYYRRWLFKFFLNKN